MRNVVFACVVALLGATACSSKSVSGPGSGACVIPCGSGCCEASQVCEANQCRAPEVTGNTDCMHAYPISFSDSGTATLRGDTTSASGTQVGTCGGEKNNEVIFSFDLSDRRKLHLNIEGDYGSELHPTVYVRSACATATSEMGCATSGKSGQTAVLDVPVLAKGSYYLYVDGDSNYQGFGTFTMTLVLSAPDHPAPDNDACAAAQEIALDGSGHGAASGSTAYATNDSVGACQAGASMTGGDVAFRFTLADTANVTIRIQSDTVGAYVPGAYLRASCDASAQEYACAAAAPPAANAVNLAAANLAPGTYFLVVDGANGTTGDFHLTIDCGSPPANDTCLSPEPILLIDGRGSAHGDTTFAGGDAGGGSRSCGGDAAADLVYSFGLDSAQAVKVVVTPREGSNFSPLVYVRTDCANQNTRKGCAGDARVQPVTLDLAKLAAGTYYLWVDGYAATSVGAFDLTIETSEPTTVPSDTCAQPEEIPLSGIGQTQVSGTTADGSGDYQGTCGGSGADLVYSITLDQAAALTATVSRDGTSYYTPVAYIRRDCASSAAADEVDCAATQRQSSVTVGSTYLTAGTYYIIVDSGQSPGAFTLSVTVADPIPNDTCAAPAPIALDQNGTGHATGDTTRASNDQSGACSNNAGTYGNDLVYSFTLAQERAVHIVVGSSSGLKPAIYLRKTCAEKTAQVACAAMTAATAATLDIPVLAAGTYYLWVDGNGDRQTPSNGAFSIDVTTSAPPPAPTNDSCASTQPLTFTGTSDPEVRTATAHGDTSAARDSGEGVGLCAGTFSGDVVYGFTLAQARMVTVKVTPGTTGFQPYAYIRNVCASAADTDMVSCAIFDTVNQFAMVTANSLPAGDYFLWVDGKGAGTFDLEVTTDAPGNGPANDNCSSPQALTFTGGTVTVTGTTTGAANDTQTLTGQGNVGADIVYTFTTTGTYKVTATVTPAPNMQLRPAVSIRSGCASESTQVAVGVAARAADPATATAASLPAGTYYVWVDSAGIAPAVTGAFSLKVSLAVP